MKFDFTLEQLRAIIGDNEYLEQWYSSLVRILPMYEIDTPLRVAAFIAQCAHESAHFTRVTENLNYRASSLRRVFPKYFINDKMAAEYANKPERIANVVYAYRMGNGSVESGDGWRYRGRGLIQLTGKNNYTLFAAAINTPLEEIPAYLETFEGAVQSACWFWDQNNLNALADSGDIVTMSKRINGGTIGLEERKKLYEKAVEVLGA